MTTLNQSLGISGHERMKNKLKHFKHMNIKLLFMNIKLLSPNSSHFWLSFSSFEVLHLHSAFLCFLIYFRYILAFSSSAPTFSQLSFLFVWFLIYFFFLISFTLHFYLNKYCMVWHLVRHMQKKKKGKNQFDLFKSHN